ncbi:MAG: TetR/AcrR family transcriptional regulator [Acidimicrobiales bacterium]
MGPTDSGRDAGGGRPTRSEAPAKKRAAARSVSAKKRATTAARARSTERLTTGGTLPFAGYLEPGGGPASRRALRNQGRRTMRRLLDAAMQAFDSRGYHATRVNDVVEIAKTSHGTFYLYFSNKEDLLRALVAEAAAEAAEVYGVMADLPAESRDWEHLREWVARYSAFWARYAPLVRAWTDLAAIDPDLEGQIRYSVRSMSGALARQVADGDRADDGVDPEVAGMAVLAMLDRFHYLREFLGRPVDDAAIDTLTTMVHRSLFGGEPAATDRA